MVDEVCDVEVRICFNTPGDFSRKSRCGEHRGRGGSKKCRELQSAEVSLEFDEV